MALNFQERFQDYLSDLRRCIGSADKAEAGRIFGLAHSILKHSFHNPITGKKYKKKGGAIQLQQPLFSQHVGVPNMEEKTSKMENEVSDVKSQLKELNKRMSKLEMEVAKEEEGLNKLDKLPKDIADLNNALQMFKSIVAVRLDELQTATATSNSADAATAEAAATPSRRGPPQSLRKKSTFSFKPAVDLKLLPGGKIITTDGSTGNVWLIDTQGKLLCHYNCGSKPGKLAVLERDGASKTSTVAVALPSSRSIEFMEVCPEEIIPKSSVRTSKPYWFLAALNKHVLAAGYTFASGIDMVGLDGQVLGQLSTLHEPTNMIGICDWDLAFTTGTGNIVRLKVNGGGVLYNKKVFEIQDLSGITAAEDGSLLVADKASHSLHLLTSQGVWVKKLWELPITETPGIICGGITHVTMDSDVCVCVTDNGYFSVLDIVY